MKLSKKKIILICISIVLVATMIPLSIWLINVYKNDGLYSPPIDEENLQVFMDNDYYLGNLSYSDGITTTSTFSLIDVLGFSAEDEIIINSLNTNIATINASNNEITVLSIGDLNLEINNVTLGTETEKKIFVIDGINISNFEDFFYAVEQKENIVLHRNINLLNPEEENYALEPTNEDYFDLYASLYGNGFEIDCSLILTDTDDYAFAVKTDNLTIRDTHFFGKKLTAENNIDELDDVGVIISVNGELDLHIVGTLMENCIIENAHKIVTINYTDITIRGCIIRNAADSCLSIQTNNDGTSNVNIENCAMSNAIVSCMTFWCMDELESDSNFITLNITGFLDIYNWRDIENSKIVPNTESLAGLVNPLIQKWMKEPQYASYYYNYNGKQYIHSAILIISTPPSKGNSPTINGLSEIGYTKRDFPFPEAAKSFIKTCNICGYIENPPILPDGKMSDNANLYRELRDGRE